MITLSAILLHVTVNVQSHGNIASWAAVIVWQLDLQLPMQSVPITTDVMCSNLDQGEVDNIM